MDAVATPESWRSEPTVHHGEHLYMSERVVVSPAGGSSPPKSPSPPGHRAPARHAPARRRSGTLDGGVGDLVGRVGVVEVRTPFAGQVVRWLATGGERVQEGQPLVWLRVESGAW